MSFLPQLTRLINLQRVFAFFILLISFAFSVHGQTSDVGHQSLGHSTIDSCELLPIGLSETPFSNVEPGDLITFFSDLKVTDSFVWLIWEGKGFSKEDDILRSITYPQSVTALGDKLYLADAPVTFQNYFTGFTDFERPEGLEASLDSLLGVTIAVPVWNEIVEGSSGTKFNLVDVAMIRLIGYDFSNSGQITVEFLSMADCVSGHRPPEVENIEVETLEGTPVEIKLKARLFNGGDPTFHISGDQQSGALSFIPDGATVTYLPLNGFTGKDVFHYYVNDGFMSSETAEVVVTVLDTTNAGINKKDDAENKNPESLALTGNSLDQEDQFTFRVWDGDEFSNVATVKINIESSNQPPQAQNLDLSVAEGMSLGFPLIASDPDGDTLQYRLLTLPQFGRINDELPNVEYTPPAFFNGTVYFTYEVEDSGGLKDTATVTIEISPVNDAPVALFSYTSDQKVPPFDVTFDGSDSYDDLAIVGYRWDFDGDGIIDSSVAKPQFQFDSAAVKTVYLTVLDAEGLSDTQEQELIFNRPPEIQIVSPNSFDSFKVGDTVNLLIEASDRDGQVETIILLDESGDEIARPDPSIPLFPLNDLAVGSYVFVAKAIDNEGATGQSAPLIFRVYKTSGDFVVRPLLLNSMLTEVSSEESAEQNYSIRYSLTDPELTPQFEDIRDTGTYLEVPSNSDDGSEAVSFSPSFTFPFYGQTFTNLYVGSNGLIVLGSSEGANDRDNRSLPSQQAPLNLIAPWWDDLISTNLGGGEYGGGNFEEITEIHYQDFGDRFIIQYSDITDFGTGSDLYTFQVVLYADGIIDFVYDRMLIESGFNPIVGLQDATGEIGVQVDPDWRPVDSPMLRFEPSAVGGVITSENFSAENNYDQPVTYTITTLNDTIDTLPDDPVWFEVISAGNTLNAGEIDSVQVDFIADPGFPVGRYEGMIRVDHNQPGLDPYIVNVALSIVADAPEVSWIYPVEPGYVLLGQPLSLEVSAEDPNGFIQDLSIFADNNLLSNFTATPYKLVWTPSEIGNYALTAVATDNDGNVVESTFDLVVTEDADDDNLPDQWELDFLGTMDFDGLDSPDGDSLTNLKELFLGTDPNTEDAGSFDSLNPSVGLSITPDTGEVPLTVTFDASASMDRDGEIVSYEWDFDGDGAVDQSTTTSIIEHTYTEPNLYTTHLRVIDDEGASSMTTKFVHAKVAGTSISPSALIDFTANVPVTGQLIDFSAERSSDTDGFIVDYHWDFSDGLKLSGAEVKRHFMTNGRYSVTLTVTDNEGMTNVSTEWVSVLGQNRSPGTVGDLWVVSGADYTYTMIDRDCGSWRRTRENSVYNISDYETLVNGYGRAAEVGYTFHIDQAGDYYLAILKGNLTNFRGGTVVSGGGLDVYLDNRRVSPDNGYFNEIDVAPTWGRYGRFYLEPGYHTIAFEKREDSFFEIYRVALAKSKESLPITGSITQSPQVNSFENKIIPIPEIKISSTADEVKLGEVANLYLDTAASDLPNPVLHYFWDIPSERLNTISPISNNYVSNDPTGLRFAPTVLESGSTGLNRVRLSLIDSEGQTDSVNYYLQFTDPVAELNDSSQIILESEDVDFFSSWREYFECTNALGASATGCIGLAPNVPILARASGLRGETYLANGVGNKTHGIGNKGSLDLPVSVSANTRYLAFYYIPDVAFYAAYAGETRKLFYDENGSRTNESSRFSKARVEYPVNGGRRSAFVDMRYQLAAWNWFAVVDSGPASAVDLTLYVEEDDKHVVFDGLKLIPVETTDTPDNQIPELIVTTEQINNFTYAFDATQSVDSDGEILGYLWHFGDGVVSRSAIPQHTYGEPGSYEVTLYVLDEDLGLSEWSSTLEVSRSDFIAPFARLTSSSDQGTIPFSVNFSTALSTDDNEELDYEIHFPNSSIVFNSEAKYVFTEPREYLIKSVVSDQSGNESSVFRVVEAFAQGVTYNASYVVEDSDVTATEFVGDGWQSTSRVWLNRLNTFKTSSVKEDFALFNFMPENSGLYQLFVAASYAQPNSSCDLETEMNLKVISEGKLDERSVVLDVDVAGRWNMAGSFDLAAFTPVQLKLQAKPDATALSIDSVRWIPVNSGIVTDFWHMLDDQNSLTVDASASNSPEGIVAYDWDFGDGSEATGATANHNYTAAGTYTVILTVTDASGRKASAMEKVRILAENSLPQIQLSLSANEGVAPFEVSPDASASTDTDGRIVRYLWDFGDGSVGDGVSVEHNYVSSGTYTLTLTLTDDRGGQSIESVTINVQAPTSGYTGGVTRSVETPLVNQSIDFDASTLVSDGSSFTYTWDLGDGTISNGVQVSHAYSASGVYRVSVSVTDGNGLQTIQELWVQVTEGSGPSNLSARDDSGTGLQVYSPFDAVEQP
ncbi:MAG: PKD repeat protein [Lentimonas sp.]|jgi:PKD repeat protein